MVVSLLLRECAFARKILDSLLTVGHHAGVHPWYLAADAPDQSCRTFASSRVSPSMQHSTHRVWNCCTHLSSWPSSSLIGRPPSGFATLSFGIRRSTLPRPSRTLLPCRMTSVPSRVQVRCTAATPALPPPSALADRSRCQQVTAGRTSTTCSSTAVASRPRPPYNHCT